MTQTCVTMEVRSSISLAPVHPPQHLRQRGQVLLLCSETALETVLPLPQRTEQLHCEATLSPNYTRGIFHSIPKNRPFFECQHNRNRNTCRKGPLSGAPSCHGSQTQLLDPRQPAGRGRYMQAGQGTFSDSGNPSKLLVSSGVVWRGCLGHRGAI